MERIGTVFRELTTRRVTPRNPGCASVVSEGSVSLRQGDQIADEHENWGTRLGDQIVAAREHPGDPIDYIYDFW
jgi:hypothetical protein